MTDTREQRLQEAIRVLRAEVMGSYHEGDIWSIGISADDIMVYGTTAEVLERVPDKISGVKILAREVGRPDPVGPGAFKGKRGKRKKG